MENSGVSLDPAARLIYGLMFSLLSLDYPRAKDKLMDVFVTGFGNYQYDLLSVRHTKEEGGLWGVKWDAVRYTTSSSQLWVLSQAVSEKHKMMREAQPNSHGELPYLLRDYATSRY